MKLHAACGAAVTTSAEFGGDTLVYCWACHVWSSKLALVDATPEQETAYIMGGREAVLALLRKKPV